MDSIILYDCEFLTADGSPSRFWCGPRDPDPVIAQIGAVRLSLQGTFEMTDTHRSFVIPLDRHGQPYALDPLFTRLTGITPGDITTQGVPLATALADLATFAGDNTLWSWGKDEFNMMAISCYVQGITPPLPATRFGNVCDLMLRAGMPYEDIIVTRSNTLAAYHKVDHPTLRAHDALDDARSVAYAVQHLLQDGKLTPADVSIGTVPSSG